MKHSEKIFNEKTNLERKIKIEKTYSLLYFICLLIMITLDLFTTVWITPATFYFGVITITSKVRLERLKLQKELTY